MAAILPDIPTVEAAIVQMTNVFRDQHHLGAVRPNKKLSDAARAYAQYLAMSGRFSHTADGRQAGDRVASTGYAWCQVAENLALNLDSRGFESYTLANKAVQGWINSPGHRENLLSPYATEIGVGIARAPGNDPKYLSVQLFARPKDLEYEFQISNSTGQSVTYTFGGEQHVIEPSFAVTHTSCNPGELTFDAIGSGSAARPTAARYQASNGVVYVLKTDTNLGLRVDTAPLEKVDGHR